MTKITALLFAGLFIGCGQSAPIETAESLATDPERLKELRKQCKADRAKLGDGLCNAVAEATFQRFMGYGTPSKTESIPKN